jgi:hypothetical protein
MAMVKDIYAGLHGVDGRMNDLKGILDSIPNLCSARRISHPCAFRISESGEVFRPTGRRD